MQLRLEFVGADAVPRQEFHLTETEHDGGYQLPRIVLRATGHAWVEDTAIDLGLRGWVRNRRDGSVEAVLAGELELVLNMIEASRRGPPAARVERLDVSKAGPELLGDARPGFWVLPTA